MEFIYKLLYWIIIIAIFIIPAAIIAAISILALLGMLIYYWIILLKQFTIGFYTVPKDWFSIVFLELFKPVLSLFKKEQK